MEEKDTQENLMSSFIIIGKTENKEMVTSIAGDLTNFKVKKNIVTIPKVLSIGGMVDGSVIQNIYITNIGNEEIEIEIEVEDRMRKTIKDVSRIDSSINSNTFIQKI